MVSKVFNSCAKIICEEHLPDLLRRNNGEITVIGIDGPTAAGKTILADTIVECLAEECNRKCWVYRLDWNLVQRGIRVSDLKNLSNHGGTFELEGELHMSLDILRGFLEKVNNFNERMCLDDSMSYFEEIQLNNLYSRTDNGEMTGQHTCKLEKELVILVEGHYTLRSELDDFIDLNILILSEMEELLARKVARVQDYRGEKAATDYFWHIDLPSFRHHLERFGENADFIVDNNNFQKPVIKKRSFYNQWLENNVSDEVISPLPKENLKMSEVITTVFSASMMVSSELKAQLKSVIELMIQWDLNVSQYMRNSIDNIEKDLSSLQKI